MADMDLDDLDGPSQVPSRTTRFAPKNSKVKPQPKLKLKAEPVASDQQPKELNSVPLKKEELDSRHTEADYVPAKAEYDSSLPSAASVDNAVRLEVEAKSEGEDTKDDPMEEDDDGDRVVREIDIFFTPRIDSNTQLYVLQYPLRPCWRPYELDERCEEVRIKPTSAEVEIDLSVDVDSKNYDSDANPRVRMTKQTLSSSMTASRATGYAVGLLAGNKLYINPLNEIVQLRPLMEHLKPGGLRKKNFASNAESTIKSEELTDEKYAGPSKKLNKLPPNSNEHNRDLGENWVPLKYHSSRSDFSLSYLKRMTVDQSSPILFSMSPDDYVSSLCPGASNDNSKTKGLPRRFLISLPLEERYKAWLCEGPPANRFDTLKHLAPNDSDEDVLGVLKKLACLVQGLWVPKTALVLEGRPGVECLARDYILLLFSKNPVISYEQVNIVGPLGKAMKSVLSVLAVERPSLRDWKFKEPSDIAFMKLKPHVVEEQEKAWKDVENQLTASIFGSSRVPIGLKNSSNPNMSLRPGLSKNPSKDAGRSSNGAVSRIPMSNETREALPKVLMKNFQMQKVCSFQQICQRVRDMAVSVSNRGKGDRKEAIAAAKGIDAPQEELLEIISQVATNIHGVYVSKSSSEHPQYDPLRKIVIDLLIAEGPNAKLKKAAIVEAAKIQLHRDITPNEYQKVLNELCVSQGSTWVLKRGDGNS